MFQGKRYALPLDVPAAPPLPEREGHEGGRPGRRRRQAEGAGEPRRAGHDGQADHQGRHLRLRHRHRQPRPLHLGLPQPALAERRQHLRARPQAGGGRPSRPRSRSPSSGPRCRTSTRSRRPPTRTAATRSSPASSACGSPAPGTSPACARPRSSSRRRRCRGSSSSRSVWSMPHQYSFPKPKAADARKRDAAWAHVRWMTDHVAEWTLKAGQVSASRKAHSDPRITADPVLKTLLAQAPNWQVGQAHAEVGRGRERHAAGDREHLHGPEAAEGGDGGPGAPDQRAAGLDA